MNKLEFFLKILIPWFFVQQISAGPSSGSASPVSPIAIDFGGKDSIAIFLNSKTAASDSESIDIFLLQKANSKLKLSKLDRLEPDPEIPTIDSVFLVNADNDAEKELALIAHWEIRSFATQTSGSFYEVRIYDWSPSEQRVSRLRSIEAKLGQGMDGQREGVSVTYRFKSAKAVRDFLELR